SELAIASLRQKHVEEAPLVIVVCANLDKVYLKFKDRGKTLYAIQDTGAAIQNMLLTVHALGLGGSWVHAFEEEAVKRLLKIPDNIRPVGIITIGFPLPYEKYYKTVVIPFENISWSEQYGKELPWVFKETWKNRFGVEKSITEKIIETKERLIENISEKRANEAIQTEKHEDKKEGISSRILNFIKKLSKPKT
ncbi:MAG: nitroreductase family protein, partial [Fervidobacterium sp.]